MVKPRRKVTAELQLFLKQARDNWKHTGAVAPSSRSLARAICHRLSTRESQSAVRIAEVGPGTGAFTKELALHMRASDSLDIYDVNPVFLEHVEGLVATHPNFDASRERVSLHQLDARLMQPGDGYDFIISGVPFNNFSPDLVEAIVEAYLANTRSGGWISFFEYVGARRVKRILSGREGRGRLSELDRVLKGYIERFQQSEDLVLANLPPAIVHHLRNS